MDVVKEDMQRGGVTEEDAGKGGGGGRAAVATRRRAEAQKLGTKVTALKHSKGLKSQAGLTFHFSTLINKPAADWFLLICCLLSCKHPGASKPASGCTALGLNRSCFPSLRGPKTAAKHHHRGPG